MKNDFSDLKSSVDKVEVNQLIYFLDDLSKLSDVRKNYVVKDDVSNVMIKKIWNIQSLILLT